MSTVGANIEDLSALSKSFHTQASRIESNLIHTLSVSIQNAPWVGPSADAFRAEWFNALLPQLRNVHSELVRYSQVLQKNAIEQQLASDDPAAINASINFTLHTISTSLSLAAASLIGTSSAPTGNSEAKKPRSGEKGLQRDCVDLLAASYRNTDGQVNSRAIPPGWEQVSDDELRALGISSGMLHTNNGRFSTTLFRTQDGQYVLAYPGSTQDAHWYHNFKGGFLKEVTPLDKDAISAAYHVKLVLNRAGVPDDKIALTGHSLGGRLATVGGIATGLRTFAFNPAGISRAAEWEARDFRTNAYKYVVSDADVYRNISNISVQGDPLTLAQHSTGDLLAQTRGRHRSLNFTPTTLEVVKTIGSPGEAMIYRHNLEALGRALDED